MSDTLAIPAAASRKPSPFLALFLQELRQHRGSITTLAVIWFTGLWVLVVFDHPVWFMILGLLHVMTISASQGGRDVIDGTEEFSFTLPPGRGQLFLARLAPGFMFLTLSAVLGGAAVALDLPQRVWSIVFSGGLTEPFAAVTYRPWYALALLVPLAAHALTFTTAALATTRTGVGLAWLAGLGGAGGVAFGASAAENTFFGEANGLLVGLALFAMAALVPLVGYLAYLRKEISGGGGSLQSGRSGVLVFVIIAAVLVFFFFALFSVRTAKPASPSQQIHSVPQHD